ncbi:MAG: single-stranded-DNA-specific exonuclease RecJ [Chromatiales bacterium]|nr:single-stranded-DNA-specific exonuclease RecJ [Chromatiales bacterium]
MEAAPRKIVRHSAPDDAAQRFPGLHPVLQRIFASRNLYSDNELCYELDKLLAPNQLLQIDQAATLLARAITANKRILIVADFDADGATSCTLAIRALRMFGAKQVDYIVPNRFEYGYGLTPEIVAEALQRQPDLIITVDNGIASIDGVAAAKSADVDVLITDHHLPGERLPAADAIVNPNSPGDQFPSKNLAGVGVIFYVMLALRARLREQNWFGSQKLAEPNMAALLDLIALGTVADVVPLDHNNRILVHQGIRRINAGRCCEGIKALLKVAGKSCEAVTTSDLGFRVGPRLNAAGRLDDMSVGIECPLTDNPQTAMELAEQLNALNMERREIEQSMKEQALADLESLAIDSSALPFGLCVFREEWHQGVIGILAARIRERHHRPVIAFAPADNGEIKGSARSIPGLHIRDTLDAIAKKEPQMLSKFGGHAMAAGLTLNGADLERFAQLFDKEVEQQLQGQGLEQVIQSDGELTSEDISYELARLIKSVSPWGQHFPEPLFDGGFRLVNWREVGQSHAKMILTPQDSTDQIDAIAFNQVAALQEERAARTIHAAYRLDINEYRGFSKVQLIIEHFEVVDWG